MPSIGWSEMMLLAVVAIVVVGPKELPRLMRVAGHWVGKARAAARDFQQAFDDMARESEIEEMRRNMDDLRHRSTFPDPDDYEDTRTPPRAAQGNGSGETTGTTDKDDRDPAAPARADHDKRSANDEREDRPVPTH